MKNNTCYKGWVEEMVAEGIGQLLDNSADMAHMYWYFLKENNIDNEFTENTDVETLENLYREKVMKLYDTLETL